MKGYPITSNDADQRLDKFLKKLLPSASLSYIYKLLRKGNIKVIDRGGKKTKQDKDYKLKSGEQVHVFLSAESITDLQKDPSVKKCFVHAQKLSKTDVSYEDSDLLIVNKSSGLNVHPGDHKSEEVSLIEQVEDYYKGKLDSLTFKPSLIHRIDRNTSGIVMIAKKKQILTQLSNDFKNHKNLKKTYFCIVLGKLSRNSGTIKKKLKRIENAKNENKVQVSEAGQEAISHYKLISQHTINLPAGKQLISCVQVTIETGRMHQIRVHMAALGNPILGDSSYGNKQLNAYFLKHHNISRQMLHAWKIEFLHPGKSKKMKVEAKLKKDMREFIQILEK